VRTFLSQQFFESKLALRKAFWGLGLRAGRGRVARRARSP